MAPDGVMFCRGAAFAVLEGTVSQPPPTAKRDTGSRVTGKCYALPVVPRTASIGLESRTAGKKLRPACRTTDREDRHGIWGRGQTSRLPVLDATTSTAVDKKLRPACRTADHPDAHDI